MIMRFFRMASEIEITLCIKRENVLGEGPLWSAAEGLLYWVDIRQRLLEWLCPRTGETGAWQLECHASALAPRERGGFLMATERGFAVFDPKRGTTEYVYHPEPERSWNRSNDGHADCKGRFWLGTMDASEQQRSGAVYRLDPDWRCTRELDGLGIPNSLVSTPDCARLYVADSREQILFVCELNGDGAITGRNVFASTEGEAATPDGSALDEEGYLWNAQWGGWRIVRYAPDGTIDRVVTLPVEQPTSCAFGSEDLSTLFITTARAGLSDDALDRQPLAGSVLSFRPGVKGTPSPVFRG